MSSKKSSAAILSLFIFGVVSGVIFTRFLVCPGAMFEARPASQPSQAAPSIICEVCFSPGGGCKSKLIYWFSRANNTIHIMVTSFTLDDVGDALIYARRRGVDVKVVFEKEDLTEYSEYGKLKDAGIQVRVDTNPALMHNKVAIIDGLITITGSYNWSRSAEEKNNENMVILRSMEVASIYEREFNKIWSASK
ncbi:MAG: phospholipase D family protein [Candidatus Bathyarchaeia archaeon]